MSLEVSEWWKNGTEWAGPVQKLKLEGNLLANSDFMNHVGLAIGPR